MTMNDRWIALLSRQPVDRIMIIPLALGYAGINAGYTLSDFYTDITGELPQKVIGGIAVTAENDTARENITALLIFVSVLIILWDLFYFFAYSDLGEDPELSVWRRFFFFALFLTFI